MTDGDGASRGKKTIEKRLNLNSSHGCGNLSGMIMEQIAHKYVFGVNFSLASPFGLTLHFCLHSWHTNTIGFLSVNYLFTRAEGLWEIRSKVTRYLSAQ